MHKRLPNLKISSKEHKDSAQRSQFWQANNQKFSAARSFSQTLREGFKQIKSFSFIILHTDVKSI